MNLCGLLSEYVYMNIRDQFTYGAISSEYLINAGQSSGLFCSSFSGKTFFPPLTLHSSWLIEGGGGGAATS